MTCRPFILLIADGVRCIYEQDLHCLSRSSKIVSVMLQIRDKFTSQLTLLAKDVLTTPVELVKVATKKDVDFDLILFFLKSNATSIIENCPNSKIRDQILNGCIKDETSNGSKNETSNEETRKKNHQAISKNRDGEEKTTMNISQESTIFDLFKYLVMERLKITLDYLPYILLLQKEGILTVRHLSMVPYSELQTLPIPTVLQYQLSYFCQPCELNSSGVSPNSSGYPHVLGRSKRDQEFSFRAHPDQSGTGYSPDNFPRSREKELVDDPLAPSSYTVGLTQFGIIEHADQLSLLLGYSKEELLGKKLSSFMTPLWSQRDVVVLIKTALKENVTCEFVRKDCVPILCHFSITENMKNGKMTFLGKLQIFEKTPNSGDYQIMQIYERVTNAIVVISSTGLVCYANAAVKNLTGWKPKQLVGKRVNILMPSHVGSNHDFYLANYLKSGTKHKVGHANGDVSLLRKDKKVTKTKITVVLLEFGERIHFIATFSPKEDWSQYDELSEATMVINSKGIIEYVNDAIKPITGYNPSALVGLNVKILMPWEFATQHDNFIQNYLKTGVKKILDSGRLLPVLHRSGTVVQAFINVMQVCHVDKIFFVGTFLSKIGYEELQDNRLIQNLSESLFQLINPVIMVTKRGLVKLFNKAAQNELGWKSEEVVGKSVSMLIPERYAKHHDAFLERYLQTGVSKVINTTKIVPFLTSQGGEKYYHMSLTEKCRDDKPLYWIAVLTPVAENYPLTNERKKLGKDMYKATS
eukprot:TRINITY_DN6134_c1_g2_i8.p1 TRINITY_DN6134_c1_g2~~TRINITY_DN6134_c1_g2_i8.p1  ORF type:complete len:754 (-),score=157.36 TRINITY_DN6134_c1_g2_i8:357-2618(-)